MEVYATGLELSLVRPIYLPYSRHFASTGAFQREESLANRRMVHHHWGHAPLGGGPTRTAIEALAEDLPGPHNYSRWRDYGPAKQFDIAKNTLAAEITETRYIGMSTDPPSSTLAGSSATPLPPLYSFYPGRQLSTPMWDRCHIPGTSWV